jgi:hypothetical protein
MAKILQEDEWYESQTSTSLYETEFERIVKQRTGLLFPGYQAATFRSTVYSDDAAARPDYALVEHGYREWWVVEMELGHHSLESHVLPQVSTLLSARYGEDEAEKLASHNPDLDRKRLQDLLKGQVPRVLVVLNEGRPDWVAPLNAVGAKLSVFELFRSHRNKYLFRFNGFTPTGPGKIVSRCRLDKNLPWMLKIDSPAALELQRNQLVRIAFEDSVADWERIDSSDTVWLMPKASIRLSRNIEYELIRLDDSSLKLQPSL